MDDVILVVKDLQPAAFIVVAVALVAIISNMVLPQVGPWVSMLTLAAVTVYVGNRVLGVESRPGWLLPLALAGAAMAAMALYRLWRAINATSNNDQTIGYVFPTALAVAALWLSIALIEFDAAGISAVAAP
jgi:hypothetical protein